MPLVKPSITERELEDAVNDSCSCGGKGPDDGCCLACEVWYRIMTRGFDWTPKPKKPKRRPVHDLPWGFGGKDGP